MDDLVNHFFEANHFIDGCLKYMHKIHAVMVPHKEDVDK
jgi:hypothetical protein